LCFESWNLTLGFPRGSTIILHRSVSFFGLWKAMCGICGKIRFDGGDVDASLIESMCGQLAHRGPDDSNLHVAGGVGLGQRRLSVIDLRHEAAPPLANEDKTVWVVSNGEVYNFRELRSRLQAKGHKFRTAGDTEVIAHLYEEHGTDCLSHMRGMFAFALWDERKKTLFAARDRLGQKPFFYARAGASLVFGSEIRAVTCDPELAVEPNYGAIDLYLTYQYVPTPLLGSAAARKDRRRAGGDRGRAACPAQADRAPAHGFGRSGGCFSERRAGLLGRRGGDGR